MLSRHQKERFQGLQATPTTYATHPSVSKPELLLPPLFQPSLATRIRKCSPCMCNSQGIPEWGRASKTRPQRPSETAGARKCHKRRQKRPLVVFPASNFTIKLYKLFPQHNYNLAGAPARTTWRPTYMQSTFRTEPLNFYYGTVYFKMQVGSRNGFEYVYVFGAYRQL